MGSYNHHEIMAALQDGELESRHWLRADLVVVHPYQTEVGPPGGLGGYRIVYLNASQVHDIFAATAEINRLLGIGFELTRTIARVDPEQAARAVNQALDALVGQPA